MKIFHKFTLGLLTVSLIAGLIGASSLNEVQKTLKNQIVKEAQVLTRQTIRFPRRFKTS